jgi:hypothetical protein
LTEDPDDCDLFYSNYSGTKYSEQYKATQRVKVDTGDSQQTIKIISFESDLVVIKQAKTGIVQGGQPDYGFDVKDHNVGSTHRRLINYIPGIGIVAVTNDTKDLKIYGYDHKWTTTIFGQNISQNMRQISALMFATPNYSSIQYINGKLFLSSTVAAYAGVLNIHSGKGWSLHDFTFRPQALFKLSNTNRWAAIAYNVRMVEMECDSIYTTWDTATQAAIATASTWVLKFKSGDGLDLIEFQKLTINGWLNDTIGVIFYVSDGPWNSATEYATIPDPAETDSATLEMPYELFATPRPVDNLISCLFSASGRFRIRQIKMDCFITPNTSINRLNRITNAQVTGFIPTGFAQ